MEELQQAPEGSPSKDHFVNNLKCARNVKKTIETLDMALRLNHLPSPFSTGSSTASYC